MTPLSSAKRATFEALYELGRVLVALDPNQPGVTVPDSYREPDPSKGPVHALVLILGSNMPRPIRDLGLNDQGFSATLSFGGNPFFITIPWAAITRVYDESREFALLTPGPEVDGVVVSPPKEAEPAAPGATAAPSAPATKRSHLSLVPEST